MRRKVIACLVIVCFFVDWRASDAVQKEVPDFSQDAAKKGLEEKIEAKQIELESIKKQIEKNRQELQRLRGEEKKIGAQVHKTEKQIDLIQRYIRALRSQEKRLQKDIQRIGVALETAKTELSQHKEGFAQRLRTIYKHGKLNKIEILLSSDSFPKLLKKYKYLSLIEQQDKKDLERIIQSKRKIEEKKKRLEAALKERVEIKREKSKQEGDLKAEKAEKEHLLVSIQKDYKLGQEADAELQRERTTIELAIEQYLEQIRRLPVEKEIEGVISSYDFDRRKGKLRWPLKGTLLTTFGRHKDEKLKTWTFNRGIDIGAPHGTNVHAVAPGRVILADWFRGYGKFLLIYHNGGYFTLYAHLSEFFVGKGDEVWEGEILATSGDTGSLDGPKLHSEVLKGKQALDPLKWLTKR